MHQPPKEICLFNSEKIAKQITIYQAVANFASMPCRLRRLLQILLIDADSFGLRIAQVPAFVLVVTVHLLTEEFFYKRCTLTLIAASLYRDKLQFGLRKRKPACFAYTLRATKTQALR